MPLEVKCPLESTSSVVFERPTASTKGVPINLNGSIAFALNSYQANEIGTYVVKADRVEATVAAGTYNAGAPVYLNVATPGTNVQATGGGGFRAVGVCLKQYGVLGANEIIEISFDGTPPEGN